MYDGVQQLFRCYRIVERLPLPIYGGFRAHLPQTSGSLGDWRAVFLGWVVIPGLWESVILRSDGCIGITGVRMSELVTVTLKMSLELRERLKARAVADDASVSALLILGAEVVLGDAEPSGFVEEMQDKLTAALRRAEAAEIRVSELVIRVERLESGREVKAPLANRSAASVGRHWASLGPVRETVVPEIAGDVGWSSLKPEGRRK